MARHEIGHLLRPCKEPLYARPERAQRIRAAALLSGAALLPSATEMWTPTYATAAVHLEGVSPNIYAAALFAASTVTASALGLSYLAAKYPKETLTTFALEETIVDMFAHRHRNFKPFSYAS